MSRSLNGRVAVVTGAGSCIGRAIALRLAGDTTRVAIRDINGDGRANAQDAGPIAILVNNAGITSFPPFCDADDDLFDRLIRIILYGPWLVTEEGLP